jgi:hypothetical protein
MTLNNPCEFIKGIHDNPMALVKNLTIGDYQALTEHLQSCENCATMVDEVIEKFKDIGPGSSPWENTRWN